MVIASSPGSLLTTLGNIVGIRGGVGEPVVCAVAPAPKANRTFKGAGAAETKKELKRQGRGKGAMRPESVVPCGDTNAGPKMQEDGKDQGGSGQGRVVCKVDGDQRDEDQEGGFEPINMQIPVGERPWLFRDVWTQARHVTGLVAGLGKRLGQRWHRRLRHRGGGGGGAGLRHGRRGWG